MNQQRCRVTQKKQELLNTRQDLQTIKVIFFFYMVGLSTVAKVHDLCYKKNAQ